MEGEGATHLRVRGIWEAEAEATATATEMADRRARSGTRTQTMRQCRERRSSATVADPITSAHVTPNIQSADCTHHTTTNSYIVKITTLFHTLILILNR